MRIRGAGTTILLYAIVLHALAGIVTGSVFKIRTLTCVLIIVLLEAVALTAVGIEIAALWILANLAAIQVGYIAGVVARRTIEQTGRSVPSARLRWPQ
jgi:hypothetical protein